MLAMRARMRSPTLSGESYPRMAGPADGHGTSRLALTEVGDGGVRNRTPAQDTTGPSNSHRGSAANGHVPPLHDQAAKHTRPSIRAPSPNATTVGGVVAKTKIHPSSAMRLGTG